MDKKAIVLLALLVFLQFSLVHALDSDNDNVSDTQEKIDGTDPFDPQSNLLEIRINGPLVVGSQVQVSLVHPSLGRIKNVDFTFFSNRAQQPLNSGSSGVVSFTIATAGRHQIVAKKNAFLSSFEFYPACSVLLPVSVRLSGVIFFLALFVSIIIGMLSYAGFKQLLFATDANYPLRKHSTIVAAYVGASGFVMVFWLYFALGGFFGMLSLFLCLVFLLVVLWAFKSRGLLRESEKKLSMKSMLTVKGLGFVPLLFAALAEKVFGKKKPIKAAESTRLNEILELKRGISENIERIEEAKKKSVEAREKWSKQEAMDELRGEISSFNRYLKRMLGLKEKPVQAKAKREKSLAELREEKRLRIMAEDLMEQMAREMNMLELPEGQDEPKKQRKTKHGKIVEKLVRIFIGKKKLSEAKANVEIRLWDENGNPLSAGNAEFFLAGKKAKPVFVRENTAGFQLKVGEYQFFIRLLGFIDSFLDVEAAKEKRSFKAVFLPDFRVVVTDEHGNELRDAFVNIVDEHGKRVEDVLENIIWKSPVPANASPGSIAIPLNPKKLSFSSFTLKVVKANYSQREVVIPTNRISTQKLFEKKVVLEKIKK